MEGERSAAQALESDTALGTLVITSIPHNTCSRLTPVNAWMRKARRTRHAWSSAGCRRTTPQPPQAWCVNGWARQGCNGGCHC
eukprot:7377577-Prymnesium_polylepis.2